MIDALELNRAVPGGRVEIFVVPDEDYPGDWFYRFQFYHPETGEIPRYDNAHDTDDIGWHHRHINFGTDSEINFQSITAHAARFLQEVNHLTSIENTDHD
ncbi:MAG: hypothetical protein J07HQW1_00019 [Haloquadratum walsbyi J07HQW1]|uniref:Uncharacterized protein n=1 Tax=Haloquadratum walsbyi J07HQW1 TaxID=1238424 RepID=U1PD37_9EURY|nr:MAG: hypothetical protein J07HQW1_00019 [Haloquadratum walsbyi J07HQW1]